MQLALVAHTAPALPLAALVEAWEGGSEALHAPMAKITEDSTVHRVARLSTSLGVMSIPRFSFESYTGKYRCLDEWLTGRECLREKMLTVDRLRRQ